MILPLVKSYGDNSIVTLSPTRILTQFFLIFPEMVARMGGWVSGAPLIEQRNMAFGRDSMTTASISITSSFTFFTRFLRALLSFPFALASFFPKRAEVDVDLDSVGLKVKELRGFVVAADLALVFGTVKA